MTDENPGTDETPTAATPPPPPAPMPPAPVPPPPPGAVPMTPPRTKAVWLPRTRVVVLGGAAVMLLGSVLPWAKAEATFVGQTVSNTTNGLDGDGTITLVLALVAAAVFLLVPRAGVVGGLVLTTGILAGLVAIIDIVDVGNKADELQAISRNADASVGIGLWLAALASIALIVGGVLCLTQKDVAPAA